MRLQQESRTPRGFTLVELLVVIGIIAVLAALVTPAVMRAQATARNAAIKAEIDMLHMAIMNYKNEYGSFPPCVSPAGGGAAAKHIQRLFPRCANPAGQVTTAVTPINAIFGWLSGYTDDPSLPVTGSGGQKKLYDFDQTRVSGGAYLAKNSQGTPYLYFDSANYAAVDYSSNGNNAIAGNTYYVWRNTPAFNPKTTPPVSLTTAGSPQPLNPDSFQIIAAGRDGEFLTEDDLSNMWQGTWKDYLDSLKQ